jgi:hypothetical protein
MIIKMSISIEFHKEEFYCSITGQIFAQPVRTVSGHLYKKQGNFDLI